MSRASDDSIGYLGPAGSWTHQACLDLFGDEDLVPLSGDELFDSYTSGKVERACVPVMTSVVGATPFLDAVLDLPDVTIVAEYSRMLGYSLLARPGTKRTDINELLAHPVAFDEVEPWLEREMPGVRRTAVASGGAAALAVASSGTHDKAAFGPKLGAAIHGLISLVDGIEAGPHNVTRWWVLGRAMGMPTGNDQTALLVDAADTKRDTLLAEFGQAGVQVLAMHQRPARKSPDSARLLIEVAGHAGRGPLATMLARRADIRVLGSYARP